MSELHQAPHPPTDADPAPPATLQAAWSAAEAQRAALARIATQSSPAYQALLSRALATLTHLRLTVERAALFSDNEGLDDVATRELRFLLVGARLGELCERRAAADGVQSRAAVLRESREAWEGFLRRARAYELLDAAEERMWERIVKDGDAFEAAEVGMDPARRREAKIAAFRAEKEIKAKLEMLRKDPARAEADDAVARELWTTEIRLAVVEAFKSIDMINTELRMLAQAPPPSLRSGDDESDARQRGRERSDYSERLDPPLSQLAPNSGPLLDRQGRPQRLFTIVDKRTQLQQGVFRPDHNLPTMSIDEYLEEERRRGGIIEGGGEASGRRPQVDEDDMDKADEETIKAREWDEFKEANPRGSGNTLNQG